MPLGAAANDGQLADIFTDVRAVTATSAEVVQRKLDYLERNRTRMDYLRCRKQDWFIGSGVVEAGCKRVIGQQLRPT